MAISSQLHKLYEQVAHLQPVLDTIIYLKQHTDVWVELTTLLIPGKNDSKDEIYTMTKWVVKNHGSDVPMHFTAYHPAFKILDIPSTPVETLTRSREIAHNDGLRYAYT